MLHIWTINIAIVVVSIILAGLIAFELFQVRKLNKTKLTIALASLGGILVAEELVLLTSFMMWSSEAGPIYAYPSAAIATMALIALILIYYIVKL